MWIMQHPRRYFSSKEVVTLTGATYRQVDTWIRSAIVRASGVAAAGKGSRRLFTFADIVEIRLLVSFTANGVRLGMLKKTVESLRAHFKAVPQDHAWASTRLVTDGSKIFRFVPAEKLLESLDGCKQLAFAFEVGDELGRLINAANELSPALRYESRQRREDIRACG